MVPHQDKHAGDARSGLWRPRDTAGTKPRRGEATHLIPARMWEKVVRVLTERGVASDAAGARLHFMVRGRLGMATRMRTEDRRVLEQVIFTYYAKDQHIKTVLFVGCDWYTAHYQRRYFTTHNYWTIDPDVSRRRFGARQHVVARLEELGHYFPGGFFDLIICNGVYGWGLNRAEDCEAALSQCHACLADAGHLLLGWNDVPHRDPAPLSSVRSLSRFLPYSFPAFGTWQYLADTPGRHTYYFYQKTV